MHDKFEFYIFLKYSVSHNCNFSRINFIFGVTEQYFLLFDFSFRSSNVLSQIFS